MAWVTEEEYQAAKQVRAYEYLQTVVVKHFCNTYG